MKALIAIAVTMFSVPVLAAGSNEEETAQPKQERQVCRRIDVASETRVSRRRVCMTAAQWRARSDISTDEAEEAMGVKTRQFSNLPTPPTS